jgi:UDP-2-acetamido-3-amino-2,3-dideoxy-glucuronate N-acetyltransferase
MSRIGEFNVIESERIDEDVSIRHFNHIWPNVFIGSGSTVGSYCEIEEGVMIGNNCTLQGRVRVGPHAVIEDKVIIKYGTIITDYALVRNDTFIGPNVITLGAEADRKKKIGAIIGKNCFIGAGTKISAGAKICDNVIIGANSFVKGDITKPGIYAGTPVNLIKERGI